MLSTPQAFLLYATFALTVLNTILLWQDRR